MAMTDKPDPGEWRRHGKLIVPTLAGTTLAAVNGYSLGVMVAPLEREFGWTRAEIMTGPFIISLMALVLAPLVGIAVDRFGPRRVALVGVPAFCAATAFLATAGPDIVSWWARWTLVGLAGMLITTTVWTAAINSVFIANRGKALAIAVCGTAVAAAIVPPLASMLVGAYGWRHAYVAMAVLCAVIVIPLIVLSFRGATDGGPADAPSTALAGFTVREGFAAPSFYKLTGAIFILALTSVALTISAIPILASQQIEPTAAAAAASLIGLGSIAGRLGGGFLLDRFSARMVAALSALGPLLTVVLLLAFPGVFWIAAIACLALGLTSGVATGTCAYLTARHFGMRSFGTLFGTINGLLLFGAGMAPIAANYVYDVTRSYDAVLVAMVPMSIAGAVLFLLLGRYPDFAVSAEQTAAPTATALRAASA